MQLFLNTTSPFARVARVIVLEKGLNDRVDLVWSDPWGNDPALLAAHPQLRIPVLMTNDGHAIAESLLIAQYLDQCGSGTPLVPAEHAASVLARTSVAYGLMESAFNLVIARKYEGAQAADASVMGQRRLAALARALHHIETSLPALPGTALSLDQITTAVALEYVIFRLPDMLPASASWRTQQWLAQMQQRPSLVSTAFH